METITDLPFDPSPLGVNLFQWLVCWHSTFPGCCPARSVTCLSVLQAELKVPDVEHQMQDRGHVDASFDSPLVESRQGSILLSADAPSGEKEDMHSNYFREESPKRTPTQPLDVISPQRRLSSGSDDTLAQSLVQTRERTSGAGGFDCDTHSFFWENYFPFFDL